MLFRLSAGLLAGLSLTIVAGCAYLPQGLSSRTSHAPVDAEDDDPVALFVESGAGPSGENPGLQRLQNAPADGLRIRKSKRGNMESYVVRGQRYFTMESSEGYSARGIASWYGPNFHGRVASNGEVYDMYRLTAAHKTLPLPTYARVTHVDNGKNVVVKINDRGPFSGDRLIDLSFAAALELGMVNDGTAEVEIKALSPQELLVMSGPDNTMGIDFYYDYNTPSRPRQKVAMDSLFYDDRSAAVTTENTDMQPQAAESVMSTEGTELLSTAVNTAGDDTTLTDADEMGTAVTVVPASTDGTAVDVSRIDTKLLEVVVPRRKLPAEEQGGSDAEQDGMFDGVDVSLAGVAEEPTSVAGLDVNSQTSGVAVPVSDPAAVAASDATVLPAVATVTDPAARKMMNSAQPNTDGMTLRYYLQAGVFANVNDAERLATNIVLEIPREEVHVKPLKNSAMYRVTVGPIISKDHASDVSAKLDSAGIENYTVKVNES